MTPCLSCGAPSEAGLCLRCKLGWIPADDAPGEDEDE